MSTTAFQHDALLRTQQRLSQANLAFDSTSPKLLHLSRPPQLLLPSEYDQSGFDDHSLRKQKKAKTKKHHSSRHSKRSKKHRSRSRKFAAYVVQLIGVLCLILAALHSFEPLAGIGFTLVVIGYDSRKLRQGPIAGRFFY